MSQNTVFHQMAGVTEEEEEVEPTGTSVFHQLAAEQTPEPEAVPTPHMTPEQVHALFEVGALDPEDRKPGALESVLDVTKGTFDRPPARNMFEKVTNPLFGALDLVTIAGRTLDLPGRAIRQPIAGSPESDTGNLFKDIATDISTDPLIVGSLAKGGARLATRGGRAILESLRKKFLREPPNELQKLIDALPKSGARTTLIDRLKAGETGVEKFDESGQPFRGPGGRMLSTQEARAGDTASALAAEEVKTRFPGGLKENPDIAQKFDVEKEAQEAVLATRRGDAIEDVEATLRRQGEARSATNPLPAMDTAQLPPDSLATTVVSHIRSIDNFLISGGGEPIVSTIKDADRLGRKFQFKYREVAQDILGEVKRGSPEAADTVRLLNNDITPEDLIIEKGAQAATPAIRVASRLRDELFDPIIKMIQDPEVAKAVGEVGYVQGYFPRFMKRFTDTIPMSGGELKKFQDDLPDFLKPSITRERTKRLETAEGELREGVEQLIEMDLFEVVPHYIHSANRTIFDLGAYKRAMEVVKQLPDGVYKDMAQWYTDNFISHPRLKGNNPDKFYKQAARAATKLYYDAYIGLNPGAAAVNLSQTVLNTMPEIGFGMTGKGIKKLFTKEGKRMLHESGILLDFPGMERALSETDQSRTQKVLFYMFQKAEFINRGIAYLGGMEKAAARGLTGEAAEKFAWEIVEKTQFFYGRTSPLAFRSATASPVGDLAPALTQFTTFPAKEGEFIGRIFNDGLRAVNSLRKGEGTVEHRDEAMKMIRFLGIWASMGALEAKTGIAQGVTSDMFNAFARLAPTPRDAYALGQYVLNTTTSAASGDMSVLADIPIDAIKAVADRFPGQALVKDAINVVEGLNP